MTLSEFGRSLEENELGGTDHGEAGPMLLAGGKVAPGIHGAWPYSQQAHRGGQDEWIDFRHVYASVLADWLDGESRAVLGGDFRGLRLIAG